MRRIRYAVAMSLDGYIAGPKGEADWIIMDPEIDFKGLFNQFDTILLGRRTFAAARKQGGAGGIPGMKTYVFSRSLRPNDHPGVTVVAGRQKERLKELKLMPGKDIWLMGGGSLFGSLLEVGMVDTVEVAVIPVVLGAGIPLITPPAKKAALKLIKSRVYRKSGIVSLEYEVK